MFITIGKITVNTDYITNIREECTVPDYANSDDETRATKTVTRMYLLSVIGTQDNIDLTREEGQDLLRVLRPHII